MYIYLYRNLFSIWIYSISLRALFEKLQQSNPHHVGLFQMLASITYYNSHFLYTNTIFDRCKDVNAFDLVQEICVVLSLPLKLYWQIVWFWGLYFQLILGGSKLNGIFSVTWQPTRRCNSLIDIGPNHKSTLCWIQITRSLHFTRLLVSKAALKPEYKNFVSTWIFSSGIPFN